MSKRALVDTVKSARELQLEWDPTEHADYMISELRTMMRIGRRRATTHCGVLHSDVKHVLENAGYRVWDYEDEIGRKQTYVALPD